MSTIDAMPSMFEPMSSDEILEKLAIGREQNKAGEGISFDEAMRRIGTENGLVCNSWR